MQKRLTLAALIVFALSTLTSMAQSRGRGDAEAWLARAAAAMGGEAALRALTAVEVSGTSVWFHREQSERPEGPWVPTFTDFTDTRNFAAGAVSRRSRTRGFVTLDDDAWSAEKTLLIVDGVGLVKAQDRFAPGGTPWDAGVVPLALLPERVVLTAMAATDAHADPDAMLHGYAHHVVSFTLDGARVRLFLSVPGMLPKAIEITRARPYETYWAPWGDLTQTLTLGVWNLEPGGIRYPRLWQYSTGDQPDGTIDITRVRFNPSVAAEDFAVPAEVRESLIAHRRRIADLPFGSPQRPVHELAPGIVQVPANWDIVEVRQPDGVVVIEAPLTSAYSAKVIEDAKTRFPGAQVKAVITTSDAWPHIGGLREYVARRVPIYALDRNVPLLMRLFAATFRTAPDALAKSPARPLLRAVAGRTVVGAGPNRIELYPFRTATGERQMMAYFAAHKLLYTSDLFALTPPDEVFLPGTISECVDAVAREHLDVERAFGMHYDVLPWKTVVEHASAARR